MVLSYNVQPLLLLICSSPTNVKGLFFSIDFAILLGLLLTMMRSCLKRCPKSGKKPYWLKDICLKTFHNIWAAFASNFAVDMSMDEYLDVSHLDPIRFLLLTMFLSGNVIFMGYRASLTSNLSVRSLKLPFSDLESLLNTDFK